MTSLHRSQISENFDFKEYVIDAGSGSRIRRLSRRMCLDILHRPSGDWNTHEHE
jgi:hypothetical protein